jgi:cytidine deaminase
MQSLLDTMFLKRFCLPTNANIQSFENGDEKINSCRCSSYNHSACIIKGKINKLQVLSFGFNQMGDEKGIKPGIHAEQDAVSKLVPLKYKKRLEIVNILVIRLSSKNKLQLSKPCNRCINTMNILPIKKGYKIQNIYYSDSTNNIVKISLKNLEKEEKHYSKYDRQRLLF